MQPNANDNRPQSADTGQRATTRPPNFDSTLIQWLPLLRRMARTYTRDVDDLVNDTVALALKRWRNYNNRWSMATWLTLIMRDAARHHAYNARRRGVRGIGDNSHVGFRTVDGLPLTTAPTQEDAADLALTLRAMRPDRRELILRVASGEKITEIAAEEGTYKQVVHKRVATERKRLRGVVG